jgi:ribosome biogenesis protein NSA1
VECANFCFQFSCWCHAAVYELHMAASFLLSRIVRRLPCAGGRVWAANAAGQVEALNLGTGRMEGALKGATGSVRALALHPGPEPILASVGLDRFLRLHSTASRKQLAAVYLKQKLTGLAWCPPAEGAAAQQETAGAGMAGEAGEQLHGDGARRGRKRAKAASK